MKKYLLFVFVVLFLLALAGCANTTAEAPVATPEAIAMPESTPKPTPEPMDVQQNTDTPSPPTSTLAPLYTIEQIQMALEGRISGTILAVERVERFRDSITLGEVGHTITYDLSQATRYRVTYEVVFLRDELYVTSIDAVTGEEHPFRQWHGETYRFEGEFVIFTHVEYFYFNDDNGAPVSTAWLC